MITTDFNTTINMLANEYVLANTPIIEGNNVIHSKTPVFEPIYKNESKAIIRGHFIEISNVSINIDKIVEMHYGRNRSGKYLRIDIGTNAFEFYELNVENFDDIKEMIYKYFEEKQVKYLD